MPKIEIDEIAANFEKCEEKRAPTSCRVQGDAIMSITNEENQHDMNQRKSQERNHKIKRELNRLIQPYANMLN